MLEINKPFNFVIFSSVVSKNFGLFANWRENMAKFTISCRKQCPLIRVSVKKKCRLIRGVRVLECSLIGENTVCVINRDVSIYRLSIKASVIKVMIVIGKIKRIFYSKFLSC